MKKRLLGDVLFLVQLGFALTFGVSQFLIMLTSTEGVSLSWFVAWEVFLLLNLWLAWRAHQTQPSRVTLQTLIVYAIWTAMIALDLLALIVKDSWEWTDRDTICFQIIAVGALLTLVVGRSNISDPLVKGWLAVFFKAVPQLVLAWNVALLGGEGISWFAVFAGHVTILSRIGQLTLAIREAGWDKNRVGSMISEVPNELSWIIVTIVLLL